MFPSELFSSVPGDKDLQLACIAVLFNAGFSREQITAFTQSPILERTLYRRLEELDAVGALDEEVRRENIRIRRAKPDLASLRSIVRRADL